MGVIVPHCLSFQKLFLHLKPYPAFSLLLTIQVQLAKSPAPRRGACANSPPFISPHHSLPTETTWGCVGSYSYSNVRGANSSRAGLFYIRRKSFCINSLFALSPFFCSFCLQLFPPIPQESWDIWTILSFSKQKIRASCKSKSSSFLCRIGH